MDRDQLAAAIRAGWTRETSADPDEWSEVNPSRGQCDVTSLVVLEYLGGDLQLAEVYLDGEQVEHHYWNQLSANEALDLTGQQFTEGQDLRAPKMVPQELIRSKYPTAREELRRRHDLLRGTVSSQLGEGPPDPLGV